jgi:hypothetical protein
MLRGRRFDLTAAIPVLDGPALALGLLLAIVSAAGLVHFTDPDYFWHYETGHYIISHRSVPTHDIFSFTAPGRAWVTHEWLSEIVIYGLQSAFGYAANTILFTGLAVGALAIAYRSATATGVSRWVAVGLTVWAAAMLVPFITVRPLIFSWFLFAVFIRLLQAERQAPSKRIWLLPPLMLLWANLHAGYVIGLALLAIFLLAAVFDRYVMHEQREIKTPALVLLASFAVTIATPNTIGLLLYPLIFLKPGNANTALITEWQSPNFHEPIHFGLAFAIVALIAVGVVGRGRQPFLTGVMLMCTYAALQSVRNQPFFALAFLPVMAALLVDRWRWAQAGGFRLGADARTHATLNWALLAVFILMIGLFVGRISEVQLSSEARLDGRVEYPVAGADFIAENYPDARFYNPLHWGGYLIHALPNQKVFVDGRPDMYGDAFMHEYIEVTFIRDEWQQVLDRYGVDVVLAESDSALASRLEVTPGWREVFIGKIETVFARSTAPN